MFMPELHYFHQEATFVVQLSLVIPFWIGLLAYIAAVVVSNKKYKRWPSYRTILWAGGVILASAAVVGPVAELAHHDFTIHMLGHLLFGMLAPLFMVLAAPMTLMLRTLKVPLARKLSRLLKSAPVRIISDPFIASILNIGGLWLLYTTDLYSAMHESIILYLIIHAHVFIAGYVFTHSMIGGDIAWHQPNYMYRSIILVLAIAGHSILAKIIYANPPVGVARAQAETGSMLMYYGGDAVDIIIIFLVCLQWYNASRPKYLDRVSFKLDS